jgi:hypothetical protein
MGPQAQPPSDASGNGHAPGIAGRVDSLGRAAASFTAELRGTAADFGRALDLRGRTQRHPYLLVAAAAGLGYVLGGGLFTRSTARLLGLAGRVAALPLVRGGVVSLAEAVFSGSPDAQDEDRTRTSDVPSPS